MLTTTNSDGTWSCRDVDLKKGVSSGVYVALCKLRNYEVRDFEPDDLDVVIENIHIGSIVEGYTVFGVWNNYCIAVSDSSSNCISVNNSVSQKYAVMRIARDGFAVTTQRYFDDRIEAEKNFSELAMSDNVITTEYWKR